MKAAIIGSRTFDDLPRMEAILNQFRIDEIISGGAKGADSLATLYAKDSNIPIKIIIPQWKKYGKSAGFKRNHLIIEACDIVFAFWDGQSKGTEHSITIARQLKKDTYIYYF